MDISFKYARDRQFYALRFRASAFETAPFLPELRFWGVDRFPCPRLSALAALIVLKDHPMRSVVLKDVEINAPIASALAGFFGVEVHSAKYTTSRRDLAGGDRLVAPLRFAQTRQAPPFPRDAEMLTWVSLDDLGSAMGGVVRSNVDVFDLSEAEKSLVMALCCAGQDVGHVLVAGADPNLAEALHRIGLELIDWQ